MSASSVADFAIRLMQNLPQMIQAGVNVAGQIQQGMDALQRMRDENRGPTQAEYDVLRASNSQLHSEFQALGGDGGGAG